MFKKIGNWERIAKMISAIKPEMIASKDEALKKWGLKAEAVAKGHISHQDLGWAPLAASTVAQKARKGLSGNILIATSHYFQSITSWVEKKDSSNLGFIRGNVGKMKVLGLPVGPETSTVHVGVAGNSKTADGKHSLGYVARLHEYGSQSGKLPARPLWRPTMEEVMKWHEQHNMPEQIFIKRMKRYF